MKKERKSIRNHKRGREQFKSMEKGKQIEKCRKQSAFPTMTFLGDGKGS